MSFFKKHRSYLSAGVIVAVVIGLFTVYLSFHWNQKSKLLPEDTQMVGQDTKSKTTANTNLSQKIIYLKCGDEEIFNTKIPDNLVGLNYNQIQKIYAGWTIDQFDASNVNMSLKIDSFCREHANNIFIGIKDGYVTVFHGKPDDKPIIKEVTKIPIAKLNPQDIDELHKGMIVHSKEELLSILEGMQQ